MEEPRVSIADIGCGFGGMSVTYGTSSSKLHCALVTYWLLAGGIVISTTLPVMTY